MAAKLDRDAFLRAVIQTIQTTAGSLALACRARVTVQCSQDSS